MNPELGVDRHGFLPCSHSNPIDPAEYPVDRASSAEGVPHGPGIWEGGTRTVQEFPSALPSEMVDEIAPRPPL